MYGFTKLSLLTVLCVSWTAGCIKNTSSTEVANSQTFKMHSCSAQPALYKKQIQGNVRRLITTARCQKDSHPNISDLAYEIRKELPTPPDQNGSSCIKEVISDLAFSDKDFETLCLSNGADGKTLSPAKRTETLKSCADKATEMIVGTPSGRSPLTLNEAEKLAKNGKLAYHVTRLRHVKSIMLTGLDPNFGAKDGLCDVYLDSGIVADHEVYNKYQESAAGYIHLVSDVKDVPAIVGLYYAAYTGASILAIRLNEDIMPIEKDSYFGKSAIKTKMFIPKEDIVEIPESHFKNFKIEKAENLMQQQKPGFVSFCKNALNGLLGRQ